MAHAGVLLHGFIAQIKSCFYVSSDWRSPCSPRIFRIPKIPVARRSSVRSAKPFLMDSLALRFLTFFAVQFDHTVFLVATPKIFSSVSVLPLPSSPARPTISPFRALKDTSCTGISAVVFYLQCHFTGLCWSWAGTGWSVHGLPSVLMILSVVRFCAGSVAIQVPSRMTVTSSAILRISAIL